jgi:hypothetical protein
LAKINATSVSNSISKATALLQLTVRVTAVSVDGIAVVTLLVQLAAKIRQQPTVQLRVAAGLLL